MKPRKRLLKNSRLYVITDKISVAGQIKEGSGVDIVQFRDKVSAQEVIMRRARKLSKLFLNTKTLFIINDYLDIAAAIDCDGVHLGQDDCPLEAARRLLGPARIIGISCHNLQQAQDAQRRGADYISIGPVFATPTKPAYKPVGLDLVNRAGKKIKIPFFAIGGINENNINQVLSSGAKRVAICSAICQAKNITLAVDRMTNILC